MKGIGEPCVRVVIVDDHPLVRESLRYFLELTPGMGVVGEAADGEEGVRVIEECRPDVLVLDLHLPRLSGEDVARRVRRA